MGHIAAAQTISTVAGTGNPGFSGDGGPALSAELEYPFDLAMDSQGNIYFTEQSGSAVRKIDAQTGIITSFFGNGIWGQGTAGEKAPDYEIGYPTFLYFDSTDDFLYVSDHGLDIIFKVDLSDSTVWIVVGNGVEAFSADGTAASFSSIIDPFGISKTGDGSLCFVESGSNLVRKVTVSGQLQTIAGINGTQSSNDGTISTASFGEMFGLQKDNQDNLYVTEVTEGKIRKIDFGLNLVTTFAGTGSSGFNGDGLPPLATQFNAIHNFRFAPNGEVFIPDLENNRIRKIDPLSNTVVTIAGTGIQGYTGDGGDPLLADLDAPLNIIVDDFGSLFWIEVDNYIIRSIDFCEQADLPTITLFGATDTNGDFCPGNVELTITGGALNDSYDWVWSETVCGSGVVLGYGTSLTYNLAFSSTIAVRAEGNCLQEGECQEVTLNIGSCVDTERINAFSPNGDNVNDLFFIQEAENFSGNVFYLYNRWGDLLKTIINYDNDINAWDGKDDYGRSVEVGTYFYIFEADLIQYSAWIQLAK